MKTDLPKALFAPDEVVWSLASQYQALVHAKCAGTHWRNILRNTRNTNTKLFRALRGMLEYCIKNSIPPFDFLQAQFDEWEPPNKYAAKYPTLSYLAITDDSKHRYERWIKTFASKSVFDEQQVAEQIISGLLRARKDLKSEQDIFKDLFLIRMLPASYVRAKVDPNTMPEVMREMLKDIFDV